MTAIRKDQAGVLSEDELKKIETMERVINTYLDDDYDPNNPRPVDVSYTRIGSTSYGYEQIPAKVIRELISRFKAAGWEVTKVNEGTPSAALRFF